MKGNLNTTQMIGAPMALLLLLCYGCCGEEQQNDTAFIPVRTARKAELLYERVKKTYQYRDTFQIAHQLSQRHSDPDVVLHLLHLEQGMTVADIGCGVGFFTFRFAKAVGPHGRVIALDIQDLSIEVLRGRMASEENDPYHNVQAFVNRPDDALLPPDSVDLAFMAHMGWYAKKRMIDENVQMLKSCFKAVKPGGRLAVLQYRRDAFDMDSLRQNFEFVGFTSESFKYFEDEDTYLFMFRKPSIPSQHHGRPGKPPQELVQE